MFCTACTFFFLLQATCFANLVQVKPLVQSMNLCGIRRKSGKRPINHVHPSPPPRVAIHHMHPAPQHLMAHNPLKTEFNSPCPRHEPCLMAITCSRAPQSLRIEELPPLGHNTLGCPLPGDRKERRGICRGASCCPQYPLAFAWLSNMHTTSM